LGEAGRVERDEMFRTFNMGVGMSVLVAPRNAQAVIDAASAAGVDAWRMGRLAPGSGRVVLT
jgi:phosphoribosylformylglycinamidine cyclo-ligase